MGKETIGLAVTELRAADEAVLVDSARSGDMNAFSRLVIKYQDRVLNTCWRISGRLEDAEDLTQETFLRALESIGTFRLQAGFYTWLFRIAVNVSISHRRRKERMPRLSLCSGEGQYAADKIASDERGGDDPSARLTALERQQLVQDGLDSLDDDDRTIIVLRDLEGFDYRQIAEILEVPEGTVKSRLHRARMELRERLKKVL
jgi:RNA polymerase sigma-70 factor (ECF subfamily)